MESDSQHVDHVNLPPSCDLAMFLNSYQHSVHLPATVNIEEKIVHMGQFHLSGVKIQIFKKGLRMKLYPVLHCG